jgi:hypothetical protein
MPVLVADKEEEIPSSRPRRYMHTKVQMQGQTIIGQTRTWTRQPVYGFTGGVIILAYNAEGVVLDYTSLHQFGVDGFRVPFKESDRTDMWFDYLDEFKIQTATGLEIFQHHSPKNRLDAELNEIVTTAEKVAGAIERLSKLASPNK